MALVKLNMIDVIEFIEDQHKLHDIKSNNLPRFQEIKLMYGILLPKWIEEYKKTGRMNHDPYFRDFYAEMSPIERNVWSDIRCKGLPFYPEIPACGYFIDFACPFLKIGIECDGAAFHDKEKDQARDNVLIDAGWYIYRLTGSECNRFMQDDIYDGETERTEENMYQYYMSTAEGLLEALKIAHFSNNKEHEHTNIALAALRLHRSKRT